MALQTLAQFQGVGSDIPRAVQGGMAIGQTLADERNKQALAQQAQERLATRQAALGVPSATPEQESPEQAQRRMLADDPTRAKQILDRLGIESDEQREEAAAFATTTLAAPQADRNRLIAERVRDVTARDGDATHTLSLLDLTPDQQERGLAGMKVAALTELQRTQKGAGASQREFEDLMEGFTDEEKAQARRVRAGLLGRAVGSAAQTIAETGTAEAVGESQAVIKQREKFAEMTGASRGKAIDKGFENIVRIDKGINTIDRAIATLEGGAKTGAVERFLPSIRAACVELSQIEGQMALDVIGGVTLGAISEAELALAKTIALPKGLDEPELIAHLKSRKAAQKKLRDYFQEQVTFIEGGGTVGGFLEMKKAGQPQTQPQQAAPAAAPQAAAQPQALPQGVTEDDIAETMRIHGVTRQQVLERLGGR